MDRNRGTTDKIEIVVIEVKEKLTSLTASTEKSTQEGLLVERATYRKKKLLRATLFSLVHNAAPAHDDGNRLSVNTAYLSTFVPWLPLVFDGVLTALKHMFDPR